MHTFYMDIVFDSSIAILGIVVPLGLAYVILLWDLNHDHRKDSATARDDLLQKRTEPRATESRAAKRYGSR